MTLSEDRDFTLLSHLTWLSGVGELSNEGSFVLRFDAQLSANELESCKPLGLVRLFSCMFGQGRAGDSPKGWTRTLITVPI